MPLSWDKKRELEQAALDTAAKAETETADQVTADTAESEETRPPGYYATCTPEERQAELRRLGIHNHGHGLPGK